MQQAYTDVMIELLLLALLLLVCYLYYKSIMKLRKISHEKQSLSVKYGKMSEQFFPFMPSYRHDSQNFRFLGTPIDGIQFNDDKIIFIEFKTNSSQLNEKQKKIRKLVEEKKIGFEELRIE